MNGDAKQADRIIDQLLDQVQQQYPATRVARIKHRMGQMWAGESPKDRICYIYSEMDPPHGRPAIPEDAEPLQVDLINQLQLILNHSDWDDDFFPALSPGGKQLTIPSAFGCTESFASASSMVHPIIDDPEDVYRLSSPAFAPGTCAMETIEKMRYFHTRTGGVLPVYITDMQGPFSVASQIWGVEDFLFALYDTPDEAHHLISLCEDAVIEYFRLMFEAVGGDLVPIHCFPLMWFPPTHGVAVSEDLLAVVSPELIRQFINPALEHIAKTFGGAIVHSCGSINHAVHALNAVQGLTGINCASTETDIVAFAGELDSGIRLISHNSPVVCNNLPLINQTEHIELCRDIFTSGRIQGACIVNPWNAQPEASVDAQRYRAAAAVKSL